MLGKMMNKYLNGKIINKFFDKLSKSNPKVLFAGGVLGTFVTLFVSYKKAPLIKDAIEEMDSDIEYYNALISEGVEDVQKPDLKNYAIRIMKHSTLPVLCTLLTIGMFTASNQIVTKRLAVATSAYAAVSKEYVDYREEVKSIYGQEVDKKVYRNTQYKKSDTLQEGQKAYKIDDDIRVRSTIGGITSCMITDLYSGIEPDQVDIDFGRKFTHLQSRLETEGYLLLNEVRDLFQVPRIPEGHYLGWSWGDNFNIDWTVMSPVNHMTGELLYDPDVYFVADYELTWSIPTDITDEIRLGKTRA